MFFEIADGIGIAAFALSGFYIAIRNKLDILGIFISAFLTALGGGIVRDTIVGNDPISLTSVIPSMIVLTIIILLFLFKFHQKQDYDRKPLFVMIDSIGLVSFSIAGSLIALEHDYSITGVILLSFITAVGGGILRDILLNEVPYVLRGGFYGIIAIIIGLLLYLLNEMQLINVISLLIIFVGGFLLRLIAYYQKWRLPLGSSDD
jgi:uncharacterized membrane protein YeiH